MAVNLFGNINGYSYKMPDIDLLKKSAEENAPVTTVKETEWGRNV